MSRTISVLPLTAPTITSSLFAFLATAPAATPVPILIFLHDRVELAERTRDLDAAKVTLQLRHQTIVNELKARATTTQAPLIAALAAEPGVTNVNSFWIANLVSCSALPSIIPIIGQLPMVERIYRDSILMDPIPAPLNVNHNPPAPEAAPSPSLIAMHVPDVWALGYDGTGQIVGTIDTGVYLSHPGLQARWKGNDAAYAGHPEWAWFDASGATTTPTCGSGSIGWHGTGTMSLLCGGAPSSQFGVAPGAKWISATPDLGVYNPATGLSKYLKCMQWMIDPQGNPALLSGVPSVLSNSWGFNLNFPGINSMCDPVFWSAIDAMEASGTLVVFAAGNEGPAPFTVRNPGNRTTIDHSPIAVGATDDKMVIAGFSSRGPGFCPLPGVKPDLSAPGSSLFVYGCPPDLIMTAGGTSFACPHVAGVAALVRQVRPDLSVAAIKQILFKACIDRGVPGKDNDYGWGFLDALKAVQIAQVAPTLGGPFLPHPF